MADREQAGVLAAAVAGDEIAFRRIIAEYHDDMRRVLARPTSSELRRCTGSARFGIEPHEAPVAEFPRPPSRKDGLGTMCTEHWRAYVKGLREARKAAMADAA